MLVRKFIHFGTEALIIATMMTLALPFLLALSSPFTLR